MKNFNKKISVTLLISLLIAFVAPIASMANGTIVNLVAADSYSILAGSGVTNTGPTTIPGDVGTHPTGTFTGQSSATIGGVVHLADGNALTAKNDLLAAYN